MKIEASNWRPIGIDDLEPAAWAALRAGTAYVTAGPGAGKSEFLAQRAGYLFETGLCRSPRQILAISFKRDAAANLRRRIADRLPAYAERFASMTFDAFTKSIIDRFRGLLPPAWAITGSYRIGFPNRLEVDDFLNSLATNAPQAFRAELLQIRHDAFLTTIVGTTPLPIEPAEPTTARDYAVGQWWAQKFQGQETPTVDFVMLNRLAELAIRANAQLHKALTTTYPYVFVDEFQDTTFAQYSFLRSVFADGDTTVTAVGDAKQRIMGWAGALGDAFAEFERDFGGVQFSLSSNFRSTQQLVDLQHRFAQRLDPQSQLQSSQVTSKLADTATQVWSFSTPELEADTIAAWIAADIEQSGRSPAEFALIARQRVADLEPVLARAFDRQGLRVRNDDAQIGQVRLQDLLKDEFVQLLVGLVQLAGSRGGQPQAWRDVTRTLSRVSRKGRAREVGSDVEDELSEFLAETRMWFKATPLSDNSSGQSIDLSDVTAAALVDKLTAFVRFEDLSRMRILADRPEDLEVTLDAFTIRMAAVIAEAEEWSQVADLFADRDAVPLLTVHRSKGLEYHTVFFIGLDGDQWWAHARNTLESTMTFFVGVSRAAERLFFTQCDERGSPRPIADMYSVLEEAGVALVRIG